MTTQEWNYPDTMPAIPEVSDAHIAFGTHDHLPTEDQVPPKLRGIMNGHPATRMVEGMFYEGGKVLKKYGLIPRYPAMTQEQGDKAILLVSAHLRSWEPKHERKMEGCATLLDRYFEVVAK